MGVSVVIEGLYDGIAEIFDSSLLENKKRQAKKQSIGLCFFACLS